MTSGRGLPLGPATVAVGLCLGLPLTPLLAPALSPLVLYATIGLALLGIVIAAEVDLPLGAAVSYFAVWSLAKGGASVAVSMTFWFALGAVLLTVLRTAPLPWLRIAGAGLVMLGVAEVFYAGLQAAGLVARYSPTDVGGVAGTFGYPRVLGAYCALAGAVASVWLLPVFVVGLLLSQSYLAVGALGVALVVRFRHRWRSLALVAVVGALLFGSLTVTRPNRTDTLHYRLGVAQTAVRDLAQSHPLLWVIGFGPGGWLERMPPAEYAFRAGLREARTHAYSEPLQWLYEAGPGIGGLLLGAWLWRWRRAFTAPGPFAPGLAALAVLCLGTFPFHLPELAGPALIVVGGAQREVI